MRSLLKTAYQKFLGDSQGKKACFPCPPTDLIEEMSEKHQYSTIEAFNILY
jgi:hypothetical protein